MLDTRLAPILLAAVLFLTQVSNAQHQDQQPNIAPLPEWLVFSRQAKLDIQILEPTGIQVWTRYKSKYLSFGVELYVNPTGDESHCDLCKNVSRPVDGKFLIQDDKLLIRLGDTIKYRVVKVKAHEVKWSQWKYVFVDKKLFYDSEDYCISQCGHSQDIAKVRYLERYLENMVNNCGLAHISEQLFFPMDHATAFVDNPERFVKARLYSIDLLRHLVNHVEHSYVSVDGVGFKMRTIMEKLKILEVGRELLGVVDYDEYLIVPSPSVPEERSVAPQI